MDLSVSEEAACPNDNDDTMNNNGRRARPIAKR